MDTIVKVAEQAAHVAGTVLRSHWGKLTDIRDKGFAWDLVTEADKAADQAIVSEIQKHFPHHQILTEETGSHGDKESDYLWVIDPLDGTTNYTHNFPFVAISIAVLKKGIPQVGIVYNPILNELYQAEKGKGAYLNKKLIHVSQVSSLEKSLLVTGFAYDRQETEDNNFAEFCHLTNCCQGVRRIGSAALDLAFVARGILDGYWERGIKPWDIAAGALLVEEAGGAVSSYDNKPLDLFSGKILATNGFIHDEMSRTLVAIRDGKK